MSRIKLRLVTAPLDLPRWIQVDDEDGEGQWFVPSDPNTCLMCGGNHGCGNLPCPLMEPKA